mmetsp:Transcript_7632/g.10870  ORF Transcript_7632/g.10870 Transcript_7632/m.10870 type:complete len:255 (+) Transcript_7632:292-1056(+)
MDTNNGVLFLCFLLLGIERVLYAYIYHFPSHFKSTVQWMESFLMRMPGFQDCFVQLHDTNRNKAMMKNTKPIYWKVMMTCGMYIKIFQFGVLCYDICIRQRTIVSDIFSYTVALQGEYNSPLSIADYVKIGEYSIHRFVAGIILCVIGQGLNIAVFQALGGIGVYYGYELGYKTHMTNAFPYNTGISDPQYWGVVLCVLGIYMMCGIPGVTTFHIPVYELFWYLMSMKVFEHTNGKRLITVITGRETYLTNKEE